MVSECGRTNRKQLSHVLLFWQTLKPRQNHRLRRLKVKVVNIVYSIIYTLHQLQQKKNTSKNININDNKKTSYIKYVQNE